MKGDLHRCFRVSQTMREGERAVTLILDRALPAQAGQFVMAWLPGLDEKPFSIMDDSPLALTVAAVGRFTRALAARTIGEQLWIRGPYGHGFRLGGNQPLLVGGGCGVAPLALLARQFIKTTDNVSVAIGDRTASQLMLAQRFRSHGCKVHISTDDGTLGHAGTVVELALPLIKSGAVDSVYACGPEEMLVNLAQACTHARVPCQVSLERYMRCGIGLCGSCHCGDLLVCRDGPVIGAERWLKALKLPAETSHR